jgi:Protein of unknown function (DUF3592)
MSFLDRFRKKTEDEDSRIARLSTTGRIVDGKIIDAVSTEDGTITHVIYTYVLSGIQFESSQVLNTTQRQRPHDYAPGRNIIVRYDPKAPANSIVV